jgi:hypothetical protein
MSNPDAAALREALERNVLHRSAPQSEGRTGVMNDSTIADVNAVVTVERSRADEMRGERGFLAVAKE